VSGVRAPLEQSERILDDVDERPVEVKELLSGAIFAFARRAGTQPTRSARR
jgi:hypothetical protein